MTMLRVIRGTFINQKDAYFFRMLRNCLSFEVSSGALSVNAGVGVDLVGVEEFDLSAELGREAGLELAGVA